MALHAAQPAELAFLCGFYTDVLLYFPPLPAPGPPQAGPGSPAGAAAAALAAIPTAVPGLSLARMARLSGKAPPAREALTKWKQGTMAFALACNGYKGETTVLSQAQLLPLLLAGACDCDDGAEPRPRTLARKAATSY